jgi:tetratricopeptide (TPR) repeat protein
LPKEVGLKPQSAELLRIRGDFWARTGNWKEAVADFSKLIELEPDNHEGYYSLAPLLVQAGDVTAYRRLCGQILTRFGGTTNDSSMAHRMGRVCLLVPPSGPELAVATSLADLSVTLGKGRINEPWCQFTKGLAEYRRGRYGSTVDWMQMAQAQKIVTGQGRRRHLSAQSYIVLAMAKHQLNQTDEAKTALATAAAIIQNEMPQVEGGDLTDGWRDWLVAHALMREAKALIQLPTVQDHGATPKS